MFREFCVFCVRLLYIVLLINLFHAEPADFSLRTITYTDYAVAGIRRLCRRLSHDGWRSGNSASRMAALCNWRTSAD